MITARGFSGQKIGVFGLGKAGNASVDALKSGGAEIFTGDDKQGDTYTQWPWSELAAMVPAPGVPLTHPQPHGVVKLAKQHNVPILGDVEILFRAQPQARYVGITGTNGKSTTTTLIAHIFKEAGKRAEVGGNLGTAALALAPLEADGTYIIELSSYQLDLVSTTKFNVAILLNLTPDHLDRHGDMAGYIAAKMHIFERQTKDDVAIIAVDDDYTKQIAADLKAAGMQRVVEVSSQTVADIYVVDGLLYDGASVFDLNGIPALTGAHNWQNAAIAFAAAKAEGIAPEKIYAAMKTFPGLRHRLQLVATIDGVRFINDSKATNADATRHALKPYKNIYWIAGGKAKSGGIEPLAPLFSHIRRAYLIGDAQAMFADTLNGKVEFIKSGTLENAVQQAANDARSEKLKGAVVLLSPACASFDQFQSFEHRGDVFCELVEEIEEGR